MDNKYMKFFATLAIMLLPLCASAQQLDHSNDENNPLKKPEDEKKFYESIETTVERYTEIFDLEDWQVFLVDSILQHDNYAMLVEINNLSKAKVGNTDIYVQCRDKWDEQMYTAFRKVFNNAQWEKYLKNGAGREKKNRDKRAEKREKNK